MAAALPGARRGESHVHHRIPRCLLSAYDRGHGPLDGAEDLADWWDWQEEAYRYGVDPEISRDELAAMIEASTVEIPGDEHRSGHSGAGDFERWGRLGGLRTLALYGAPWFSLLALRRWEKVGPGKLARAFAAMERGRS